MLVLTRKIDEKIYIGDDIVLTVVEIQDRQVRIGIKAPKNVSVFREELLKRTTTQIPRQHRNGDEPIN